MIGLLGIGTVGQGVIEILKKQPRIQLQKVLVRSRQKGIALGLTDIMTADIGDLLNDPAVQIVLDCTGADAACDWLKTALKNGKHVVTSNKKLVSEHLEELTALAERQGVAFLYEAAVGAAIPLLKPLRDNRLFNDIWQVEGVLNGTSNYILTNMRAQSYQTALRQAQQLGYAEADPTADVGGYDARRKLRIVASMAFGAKIEERAIALRGITALSQADLTAMAERGYAVKLLAKAWRTAGGIAAYVMPTAISKERPLAHLEGTENCGVIYGDNAGPLAFSGYGAGKLPTAYAMLVDAFDIVQGNWSNCPISDAALPIVPFRAQFYFRPTGGVDQALLDLVERPLGKGYISKMVAPTAFDNFTGPLILMGEEDEV